MKFPTLDPIKFRLLVSLLLLLTIPYISFSQTDACGSAPLLTPSTTCTPTTGTLPAGATYSAITTIGCGTINLDDVWYAFNAKTTNPTITYTAGTLPSGRIQLFSGSCAALNSLACGTTSIAATGLTVGTKYWIRINSTANTNSGTFTICVTDPIPANDECDDAIVLTAGTSCVNTGGNMYGASPSAVPVAPCSSPVLYDLWYYFMAPSNSATVALSSLGASIGTPSLQLFSGDCGGLVSLACGTTSVSSAALIPNAYYYIRVYGSTGSLPASQTNANFNICVTYTPTAVIPSNDNCAGAISLPVTGTCSKTLGTIVNATSTASAPVCGIAGAIDVWYSFVATSTSTTINVGDLGANFSNRRIQLLTGGCGSLSSASCVSASSITATTVIGTSYLIRVISTTTPAPATFGEFTICVINTLNAQRFGNSYVNITKQTTGGVVEPNDILEIRMTINHTSGTIYRLRYLDSVPSKTTMLTGAGDRLRALTNEGIVLQNYTLAGGDDPGTYIASPPAGQYQVRMNLGFDGTTSPPAPAFPPDNTTTEFTSATGQLATGNIPNVFGNALFATAFRVRVTGVVGDTITLRAGKFIYRTSLGGPDIVLTSTPYKILIGSPMSLCSNATGINMSAESGGTFGTGTTLNRGTNLAFPIPAYTFVNISSFQSLGDGQYSIVKNMSPRSGTNRNAERTPISAASLPDQLASAYRMHGGHWDIDGDHTGTTNAVGNTPESDGVSGGYMLMVNADYVASETYRQTLNNLCPNTYYEFSAWLRNICPTCGNDYTTGNNYSPRQPGVMPNLTFALDNLDRYNTGEMPYYNGAPALGWVKKGFLFVTGPSQTSATFSIRNNSQGGGGNDWVMDDITVATCLPNMAYSPSNNPTVCVQNASNIADTIRSLFNNYVYYKWQRSVDGGLNFFDISGTLGPASPTFNATLGMYQYVTNHMIPPGSATLSDNGDLYRVVAATTVGNLGSTDCVVTDGVSFVTLSVLNCGTPLKTDLLSFNGKLSGDKAQLNWTTSKEEEALMYSVERSNDGISFNSIATLNGYNNPGHTTNQYSYIDSTAVTGKVFYRVVISSSSNNKKYTRIIDLSLLTNNGFTLSTVINPFYQSLDFSITSPADGKIDAELLDMFGKVVKRKTYFIHSGLSLLSISETESLPAGTYILRIRNNEQIFSRKVLKRNQQ